MAKFENTLYAKLWDSKEGKLITQTILQDPKLIHANHGFWRTKFNVSSSIIPTNPKGRATFVQEMTQVESGGMMDMRAPLGDSIPMEKGNLAYYTGTIPDFIAKGYVETAMERDQREKLFSQFDDSDLIKAYATEWLQPALDQANQTLSNMAAQAISTGQVLWNYEHGVRSPLYKAEIPAENFLKAGAVVWSNTTDCKILDQVRKIYKDVREHLGMDIKMQLEITRNQWLNNWLNNAQVLAEIRYYYSLNNQLLPQTFVANTDMAMRAIAASPFGDDMPEIVIVEEAQFDSYAGSTVHGWNDNTAVLRPVGKAGNVLRTSILDEEIYTKYGNKLIDRTFTGALNGLALVMNSVIANGNLKEWHSDLMMSAIPVLDKFLYHYIIDTTQTAASTF